MRCPYLLGESGKKQFELHARRRFMQKCDFKCSVTNKLFINQHDKEMQTCNCLNEKHVDCPDYKKEE